MDVSSLGFTRDQNHLIGQLAISVEIDLGIKIRITKDAINIAALLNAALVDNEKIRNHRKVFVVTLRPEQRTALSGYGAMVMHPQLQDGGSAHKHGARSLA